MVTPRMAPGRKDVLVAFDGEVARLSAPIDIRVLPRPLYLVKFARAGELTDQPDRSVKFRNGNAAA